MGSIIYGLGFRSLPYHDAFVMMSCIVMATSFLTIFIHIPCHAGMLTGHDNYAVVQARERFRLRKEAERAAALQQQQEGGRTAASLDSEAQIRDDAVQPNTTTTNRDSAPILDFEVPSEVQTPEYVDDDALFSTQRNMPQA
jgi:hypothetical protein